jgi:hypothetical protein
MYDAKNSTKLNRKKKAEKKEKKKIDSNVGLTPVHIGERIVTPCSHGRCTKGRNASLCRVVMTECRIFLLEVFRVLPFAAIRPVSGSTVRRGRKGIKSGTGTTSHSSYFAITLHPSHGLLRGGQLNTDVRGRTSTSRHGGISGAAPAIARQM